MKKVEKRERKAISNPETDQDIERFQECFRNKCKMWYCAFLTQSSKFFNSASSFLVKIPILRSLKMAIAGMAVAFLYANMIK